MGALQAKKSCGRGPKVMILRFFTPMMARAMGRKSRMRWAVSSAVPPGASGM